MTYPSSGVTVICTSSPYSGASLDIVITPFLDSLAVTVNVNFLKEASIFRSAFILLAVYDGTLPMLSPLIFTSSMTYPASGVKLIVRSSPSVTFFVCTSVVPPSPQDIVI